MHHAGKTGLLLFLLATGFAHTAPLAQPAPQGSGLGNTGARLTGGVGTALKAVPAQVGETFGKSIENFGKKGSGDEDDIIQGPFEDDEDDEDDEEIDTQSGGAESEPSNNDQTPAPSNEENVNPDPSSESGLNATAPNPKESEVRPTNQTNTNASNHTRRAEAIAKPGKAKLFARNPQLGGGLLGAVMNGLGLQDIAGKKDKDRTTTTSAPTLTPPTNSSTSATRSESLTVPVPTATSSALVKFVTIFVTPGIASRTSGTAPKANPTTSISMRFKSKAPIPKSLPSALAKNRRAVSPAGGDLGGLDSLGGLGGLDSLLPELQSVAGQIVQTGNQAARKRDFLSPVDSNQLSESFPDPLDLVNELTPDAIPIPGVKKFAIKKITSRSKRGLLPPIGLDRFGLDDGISLQDIAPPDLPVPGLSPPKEEKETKKPEETTKAPEKKEEDSLDDIEEDKLDGLGKTIEDKVEGSKKEPKEDREKAEIDPTFGLDQVGKLGEQANLKNLGVPNLLANVGDAKTPV